MPSIKRENKRKPKGGRAKRANYDTVMIRVPIPIRGEVEKLIEKFHLENDEYMALPIQGRWWEILGVHPWSKPEEVKVAWKKLALKYHPDVNKRRDAEDRIKAVNLAYENFCKTSLKNSGN